MNLVIVDRLLGNLVIVDRLLGNLPIISKYLLILSTSYRPRKVFRPSKVKYYYSVPSTRGCGITMIGGITSTGRFHYLMLENTSSATVEEWFKLLASKENLNGAVIVMVSNHCLTLLDSQRLICHQ